VLFAVTMRVDPPDDLDPQVLAQEKAYSHDLQRAGKWVHIWRIAGRYANLSIFDVDDNDELHDILWNLPLFPYMTIDIQPLAKHPAAL